MGSLVYSVMMMCVSWQKITFVDESGFPSSSVSVKARAVTVDGPFVSVFCRGRFPLGETHLFTLCWVRAPFGARLRFRVCFHVWFDCRCGEEGVVQRSCCFSRRRAFLCQLRRHAKYVFVFGDSNRLLLLLLSGVCLSYSLELCEPFVRNVTLPVIA